MGGGGRGNMKNPLVKVCIGSSVKHWEGRVKERERRKKVRGEGAEGQMDRELGHLCVLPGIIS